MSLYDIYDFIMGKRVDGDKLFNQIIGLFSKQIIKTQAALDKIEKRNSELQNRVDFVQEQANKKIDAIQSGLNKYVDNTQKEIDDSAKASKKMKKFMDKLAVFIED